MAPSSVPPPRQEAHLDVARVGHHPGVGREPVDRHGAARPQRHGPRPDHAELEAHGHVDVHVERHRPEPFRRGQLPSHAPRQPYPGPPRPRHDHRHVPGSLVERRPRAVGQERAAVRHGDAAPAPLVPHAEPAVAVVGAHGRVEPRRERGRGGGGVDETGDGQRLDRVRRRLRPEDQAREDAGEGGGERDCGSDEQARAGAAAAAAAPGAARVVVEEARVLGRRDAEDLVLGHLHHVRACGLLLRRRRRDGLLEVEAVERARGGVGHGRLVHLAGEVGAGGRRVDTAVPVPVPVHHHRLLVRINLHALNGVNPTIHAYNYPSWV
jgi:hypothetical protein